ncbi:MAG: hypothetical protein KDB24_17705 [Microthrixaceae bacterium]|nr:hypothetical protein [Microthrixaceae bacterium]
MARANGWCDVGVINFFEADAAPMQSPREVYPPDTARKVADEELDGTSIRVHHAGSERQPQLLEISVQAGVELANHSHQIDEIIVVTGGELSLDGRPCPVGTSAMIPAGTPYAIVAGPEGGRFLNFRPRIDFTYAAHGEAAASAPDPE